jgi:hypothetical protein
VRRLLTWLLVTLGIAAFVRKLRRRSTTEVPVTPPEPRPSDDPADALRQKLAESRTDEPGSSSSAPETSVDERRADVHAEGRAALDEMRPSSDG